MGLLTGNELGLGTPAVCCSAESHATDNGLKYGSYIINLSSTLLLPGDSMPCLHPPATRHHCVVFRKHGK